MRRNFRSDLGRRAVDSAKGIDVLVQSLQHIEMVYEGGLTSENCESTFVKLEMENESQRPRVCRNPGSPPRDETYLFDGTPNETPTARALYA